MSVTIRPYVNGGWEVDIRLELPDGSILRERKKAPSASKTAAQRWGEARERVLLVDGKPKRPKDEEVPTQVPTLRDFAPRFVDGYAKANRLKPSGIAAKKSVLNVHLIPEFGDKPLDQITTEDVQRLKASLEHRAPKTVNNILTVLSVLMRTAMQCALIERTPCAIKLLHTSKPTASFHDFEEYEQLVEAATGDEQAYLIVLLGGEAGLRCGEMMALQWSDVDLTKRQLCVARSEWKGHITAPKSGRLRYVPLTGRLTEALRRGRHLRGERILCDKHGKPLTQKVIQVMMRRIARRRRKARRPHPPPHLLLASCDAGGARPGHSGVRGASGLDTTQRYMHLSPAALDAAIRLLEGAVGPNQDDDKRRRTSAVEN